jgi:mitochondrial fission protein ELM1
MSGITPLIWALLGERTGDNNQVLALAEQLGLPFKAVTLSYARIAGYDLGRIRPEHLGASLLSLNWSARAQIKPPWPDLAIGVGRRSVPVARYIRQMSSGRTKLVRIGNPRIDPRLFDLVITTRQYDVLPSDNVLTLPVAMSRFRGSEDVEPSERRWLHAHSRPHLLLAVGGNTTDVELPREQMVEAAAHIASSAGAAGGTVLVAPSQRTDQGLLRAIEQAIGNSGLIVPNDGPSFAALLADADQIFVTADSISMLSEAIVTGKPVGMVPVELTDAGLRAVGERKALLDFRSPKRDPRRFWSYLQESGLIGTVEAPKGSPTANPVEIAARAVRSLLGEASQDIATTVAVNQR